MRTSVQLLADQATSATEWVEQLIAIDADGDRQAIAPWCDYETILRAVATLVDAGHLSVSIGDVAATSGYVASDVATVLRVMVETTVLSGNRDGTVFQFTHYHPS